MINKNLISELVGDMSPKQKVYAVFRFATLIGAVIFFLVGASYMKKAEAKKINCEMFATRKEAQLFFENNKKLYRALDRDHDGQACEDNNLYE